MPNDWRRLDDDALDAYYAWVAGAIRDRAQVGRAEYGQTFQGDPLDHAIEEALDILFYLYQMRRRRNAKCHAPGVTRRAHDTPLRPGAREENYAYHRRQHH